MFSRVKISDTKIIILKVGIKASKSNHIGKIYKLPTFRYYIRQFQATLPENLRKQQTTLHKSNYADFWPKRKKSQAKGDKPEPP